MAIRVGILGYGNLGKGVECAVKHNPDMELKAVFTRRNPDSLSILTEGAKVFRAEEALSMKDEIDVMILCGGSATDLPAQTPEMAAHFNVIDSFDTHANIPRHFEAVDKAAKESGHVGIISVGWDPGMFSLNRLYANAILLGQGREPGPFRCNPQNQRREGRKAVYHSGGGRPYGCEKWKSARAYHQG